jgi:hypothetical protein
MEVEELLKAREYILDRILPKNAIQVTVLVNDTDAVLITITAQLLGFGA